MAISNVSSNLRAGVCTSTTRPTAPYEGQTIYETDTDKIFVWNGSSWVAPNTEINGMAEIGENLADFDTLPVYNLSGTQNSKSFLSRFATYIFGKVGGAGTISSTGTMSLTQATYSSLSLSTGWADYTGDYGTPQYTKLSNGLVSIRGLVKNTNGAYGTIAVLPAGFRPPNVILTVVACSGGAGRVDVYQNGLVTWNGTIAGSPNISDWVSLAPINFVATQ